jgi:hypothetical protein
MVCSTNTYQRPRHLAGSGFPEDGDPTPWRNDATEGASTSSLSVRSVGWKLQKTGRESSPTSTISRQAALVGGVRELPQSAVLRLLGCDRWISALGQEFRFVRCLRSPLSPRLRTTGDGRLGARTGNSSRRTQSMRFKNKRPFPMSLDRPPALLKHGDDLVENALLARLPPRNRRA